MSEYSYDILDIWSLFQVCIAMKFYEGSVGDKMARLKGGRLPLSDALRYCIGQTLMLPFNLTKHIVLTCYTPMSTETWKGSELSNVIMLCVGEAHSIPSVTRHSFLYVLCCSFMPQQIKSSLSHDMHNLGKIH